MTDLNGTRRVKRLATLVNRDLALQVWVSFCCKKKTLIGLDQNEG